MAELPIVMKQLNNQGQYDTLYPATTMEQVSGDLDASRITGTLPELDGYYTKDQTLTSITAGLYGLGSDAVPNDVFANIAGSINGLESQTMMVKLREYTVSSNTTAYNLDLSGLNLSSYKGLRLDIKGNKNSIWEPGLVINNITSKTYYYIAPNIGNPVNENCISVGYSNNGMYKVELWPFNNWLSYFVRGISLGGSRLEGVWKNGYNEEIFYNQITSIRLIDNYIDSTGLPINTTITLYGINLP